MSDWSWDDVPRPIGFVVAMIWELFLSLLIWSPVIVVIWIAIHFLRKYW